MDARTNDTTGLGKGKADLYKPANLSSLVFMPVGNANWTPTDDVNKLVMYGHDGVIIKDSRTGTTKITITDTKIIIHGDVEFTGTMKSNGHVIDNTHTHTGVQTGGGTTGQVS